MNNTKWTEIFKAFYYDIKHSKDPKLSISVKPPIKKQIFDPERNMQ